MFVMIKLNQNIIIDIIRSFVCLWLCFQDKPGTCVLAGLQGGLQNPVFREEGQMNDVVYMLLVMRTHRPTHDILGNITKQHKRTEMRRAVTCNIN